MAVHAIETYAVQAVSSSQPMVLANVSVTDEHSQLAASIVMALSALGSDVQIINSSADAAEELVVTAALGDGNASDIHWRALAQAQAFRKAGGRSLVLLQDTGGRFEGGPSLGWRGGMAALARTAALEWPDMRVRCVDLAVDTRDLAGTTQRLLVALSIGQPLVGVDLAGRVYSTRPGQPLPEIPHLQPHKQVTDVWLVSGGARGVTAACIEALAKRTSGRFALLGRSVPTEWPVDIAITNDIKELRHLLAVNAIANGERPAPKDIERTAKRLLAGQEIRNTLSRLEASGVVAHYYPCNITDQRHVHDVVAQIQNELGQVTAMVHGAGVLADSMLEDKTRLEFNQVFDTKVGGLQNLLTALGGSTLSYLAFFSSAAAFYGNTGQGDYAMANEILNRVAQSYKQLWPESIVKSFNWGPWESGMVDQTLARYFKERGIGLIPVQEGATLFADEMLAGDINRVELLVGDSWAG